MNRWMTMLLAGAVAAGVVGTAQAQRRTTVTAAPAAGKPLNVIYKQDFNEDGVLDNFQESASWCDDPAGAFGSKGSLKTSGSAERYMKWVNDGTTIVFMYYLHGMHTAYFQAFGNKANKNLHAELSCEKQDVWQSAKIKADSLVGWGGGASSPGETFKNMLFVAEGADKSVENPYMLIDNVVIYSGDPVNPPSAPGKLEVSLNKENKGASLNWDPSTDDVGVYKYEVYRGETETFEANAKSRLATVADNYFEDLTTEAGKTYFYKVVAKNVGGLEAASAVVKYASEQAGPGAGGAKTAAPAAKAEF